VRRPPAKLSRFRRAVQLSGMIVLTLGAAPLYGQASPEVDMRRKFEAELSKIDADFEGVFGAQFVDLTTGEKISLHADQVTATASAIKVAILIELFRQADAKPGLLKEQRPFTPAAGDGGGMARLISPSSSLSLEDIAKLMINLSENNATNILIDEVGMQNVNSLIATLGLTKMKLQRKMLERDKQARGEENISSPADGATLMTKIAKCDLPISKTSCDRVREILEIAQPDHPGKDPIPNNIPIAFKWGGLTGVSTAWAIVDLPGRPYVFAIMTAFGTDNAPAVRAASAAAFGYFSRLAGTNPYGSRVTVPRTARPRQD
jgi:beta-lactamase class A